MLLVEPLTGFSSVLLIEVDLHMIAVLRIPPRLNEVVGERLGIQPNNSLGDWKSLPACPAQIGDVPAASDGEPLFHESTHRKRPIAPETTPPSFERAARRNLLKVCLGSFQLHLYFIVVLLADFERVVQCTRGPC